MIAHVFRKNDFYNHDVVDCSCWPVLRYENDENNGDVLIYKHKVLAVLDELDTSLEIHIFKDTDVGHLLIDCDCNNLVGEDTHPIDSITYHESR